MKKFVFVVMLVLLFTAGLFAAKNVILLIGDGMGFSHITLTSYFIGKPLYMMGMPYAGAVYTYSSNSYVTDSAAAGTALAAGFKTYNGAISVLPNGEKVITLMEAAKRIGKSTAVLTTTRVTHATPGAFYAHVESRKEERSIAEQLVNTMTIDVAMGGGMKYFTKELLDKAERNGFTVITNRDELTKVSAKTVKRVLGLFARSHLPYYVDNTERPTLAEMLKKTLEILSKNEEGFVIMVEGGRIDHASHGHDVLGMIYDTIEFDEAVKVALDYAKEHGDTLVVVTADHETGGLLLSGGSYSIDIDKLRSYSKISVEALMKEISPQNAREIIKKYYGIDISDEEYKELKEAFAKGGYAPSNTIGDIVSQHAQIRWGTHSHTGVLIPLFADGPGAEKFSGILDNTEIPRLIAEILNLPLYNAYFEDLATSASK